MLACPYDPKYVRGIGRKNTVQGWLAWEKVMKLYLQNKQKHKRDGGVAKVEDRL
jgi:hypothetical protein